MDIGRRFPLFATSTPEDILNAIDVVSVRQVEARLRGVEVDDLDETTSSEEATPHVKESPAPKAMKSHDVQPTASKVSSKPVAKPAAKAAHASPKGKHTTADEEFDALFEEDEE